MKNLAIMAALVMGLISFTRVQEFGCLTDTVLEPVGHYWEALTTRARQAFDFKTHFQECRLAEMDATAGEADGENRTCVFPIRDTFAEGR